MNEAEQIVLRDLVAEVHAKDARIEELREALSAARDCILIDRAALADCHMDPVTNEVDAEGASGVAEYDAVLAQIDAALAAPAKLTDEQIEQVMHDLNVGLSGSRGWGWKDFARAIERALEGK